MRRERKYHYIYKTTCKVTSKFYVGMHSTDNLEDGYIGSGKRLKYSIRKHGLDNHVNEILEFLPDRSSLKSREKEIVNEMFLEDPLCMNLQLGGGGGFSSDEHQRKASLAGGLKLKEMLETDPALLKKRQETASSTWKKLHAEGKLRYDNMKGKNHSGETKRKIKETRKERGVGEGVKNSQYGTFWVTNGVENKKIKADQLKDYIDHGWTNGYNRKLFNRIKY